MLDAAIPNPILSISAKKRNRGSTSEDSTMGFRAASIRDDLYLYPIQSSAWTSLQRNGTVRKLEWEVVHGIQSNINPRCPTLYLSPSDPNHQHLRKKRSQLVRTKQWDSEQHRFVMISISLHLIQTNPQKKRNRGSTSEDSSNGMDSEQRSILRRCRPHKPFRFPKILYTVSESCGGNLVLSKAWSLWNKSFAFEYFAKWVTNSRYSLRFANPEEWVWEL